MDAKVIICGSFSIQGGTCSYHDDVGQYNVALGPYELSEVDGIEQLLRERVIADGNFFSMSRMLVFGGEPLAAYEQILSKVKATLADLRAPMSITICGDGFTTRVIPGFAGRNEAGSWISTMERLAGEFGFEIQVKAEKQNEPVAVDDPVPITPQQVLFEIANELGCGWTRVPA